MKYFMTHPSTRCAMFGLRREVAIRTVVERKERLC